MVACVACAGHGRRGQSDRRLSVESERNPAQVLAEFLVELNPVAAFKPPALHAAAFNKRYQSRQAFPSMSGFENPSLLMFSRKGQVTIGLGPELKPTEAHFEPSPWQGDQPTPVYGAVAVGLPMGMVFEESKRFPNRYEVVEVKAKTNAAQAGLRPGDLIRATSMSSEDSHSVFTADGQDFDALIDAIKSNAEQGHAVLVIERNIAPLGTLTICTGGSTCKSFKGFNSKDALTVMRAMATTHKGIDLEFAEHLQDPAVDLQTEFAEELIEKSKCFNRCGRGVSIYNSAYDDLDKEVDSVPKALTMLKSLGLQLPTATSIACLRFFNAQKKIEAGEKDAGLTLLSDAIKAANTLGIQGAAFRKLLYEARGDLHEDMGDANAAQEDRKEAETLKDLRYPVAA